MDILVRKINYKQILICCLTLLLSFISCDKEVSRSPLEPEAPEGFIYVDSEPRGFTIFLNNRNTGRLTPDSISYMDADQYIITLKKQYFKDTSVVVFLDENEKENVFIDIVSNPSMYGNLILATEPSGASITINDSLISQVTPFTIQNLWPGRYTIKFGLYNHRDFTLSAIVESYKSRSYSAELRDTSVWVDYQVFNSGIPSNSLNAITFDQNNVKWIGTQDKGLVKFDEVSFVTFNTVNSPIPSNRINCISIDPSNKVWVGTDLGIGIYDGMSWTIYNRQNSGLTTEIINTIRFDEVGNAWIGTAGNLVKFDGINWFVYDEPHGKDWINDIYIENENKLYLGTRIDGIFVFENQTFTWMNWFNYVYCTMTVSSIEKDMLNNVWFCFLPDTINRSGISVWDGTKFTNIHVGTFQNDINHIFIDAQNDKWIATSDGLLKYDNQDISTFFTTRNSLISSNQILSCIKDLSGNIWATTFASGLNKYKPPQ